MVVKCPVGICPTIDQWYIKPFSPLFILYIYYFLYGSYGRFVLVLIRIQKLNKHSTFGYLWICIFLRHTSIEIYQLLIEKYFYQFYQKVWRKFNSKCCMSFNKNIWMEASNSFLWTSFCKNTFNSINEFVLSSLVSFLFQF